MNYKDYQQARDAAWSTLIETKAHELPLRISDVCRHYGFILRSYKDGGDILERLGLLEHCQINDGFATVYEGRYYIFYDQEMGHGRIRFTIAHEVGHIVLGHLSKEGQKTMRNREPQANDSKIEVMANIYASRLLAPACVLHDLNAVTPETISQLCDISRQAAAFRAERLKTLKQRDRFDISPLERKVHRQFAMFIIRKK